MSDQSALVRQIEDRRVVWITYQSQRGTEPVAYDVHPYRLTRHLGSLYLIGLNLPSIPLPLVWEHPQFFVYLDA